MELPRIPVVLLSLVATLAMAQASETRPPDPNWVYSPPSPLNNNVLSVAHVYAGDLFMCTGTLVSASVVIAPAHCVVQSHVGMFAVDRVVLAPDYPSAMTARNKTAPFYATSGFKHRVISVIPFPAFEQGMATGDVALLVLDRSFQTNFGGNMTAYMPFFRPAFLPDSTPGSLCSFWPDELECRPLAQFIITRITTTFYGYDPQLPEVPRFPSFPFRGRAVTSPKTICNFGDVRTIVTDDLITFNKSEAAKTRTGRYEGYTCACGEKFGTNYTWTNVPVNRRGDTASVTSHVTMCYLPCIGDSGAPLHGFVRSTGYVLLGMGARLENKYDDCMTRDLYYVNQNFKYNPGYWGWNETRPIGMQFIDLSQPTVAGWVKSTVWSIQTDLKTPPMRWANIKTNSLAARWLSSQELKESRTGFHASLAIGCKRGRVTYLPYLSKCVGKLPAGARPRATKAFDEAVCGVMAGGDVDRVRVPPALVAWARCHCTVDVYADIATEVVVGAMLNTEWQPYLLVGDNSTPQVPRCSNRTAFMASTRPDILAASPRCGDGNMFDRLVQRAIKPVAKRLRASNSSCTLPPDHYREFQLKDTDFLPPIVSLVGLYDNSW